MAMIELTADDGHRLECWIEPAQGARKGGIVILQEIFGVTDQLKRVAARYAGLGYEIAIPALFDRQGKGQVVDFDDIDRARALMQGCDPDLVIKDIAATVDQLAAHGKVALFGFCWGGGQVVRAAQRLDIAGGVAFYGTRIGDMLDQPLKAPVQGHFGTNDPLTPPDMLAKAQAHFGPAFEMFSYEAGHAFGNDERPSYVAKAAEQAHERAAAFFAKYLD